MSSNPIEAAAKVIDPLAFEPVGACPPRGYESHTAEALSRVIATRRVHALRVAERVVAAYHDAELAALRAQLADCQSVVRARGHAEDCATTQCCKTCGMPKLWTPHRAMFDDYPEYHEFQPGPCSCGHDRVVGGAV